MPLTRVVPGLGWWRSVQNDVTADVMGTIAPPPGDVVIRVSMFRSWGLNPVDGMAGVPLNSLTSYVIRFAAPSLGLVLLVGEELAAGPAGAGDDGDRRWPDPADGSPCGRGELGCPAVRVDPGSFPHRLPAHRALAGLGILDAALVVVFVDIAGLVLEPDIIAAFIVGRVISLGGPWVLGLISLAAWRARVDRPS